MKPTTAGQDDFEADFSLGGAVEFEEQDSEAEAEAEALEMLMAGVRAARHSGA